MRRTFRPTGLAPILAQVPVVVALAACAALPRADDHAPAADVFYGTLEPFASDAIYFVLTDRFVNGDPWQRPAHARQ